VENDVVNESTTQDAGSAPAQLDFDSMSTEQLEQHIDKEQAASQNDATPAQAPTQQSVGETNQPPQPTLAQLQEKIQNLEREAGRWRGLQGQMAKLPQAQREALRAELEERRNQQREQTLTPEERQAEQFRQAQAQALQKYTREQAVQALEEQFGPEIQFLRQAQEDARDSQHLSTVSQMAEQNAPGSSKFIADLFKQNYNDLNSQDPEKVQEALRWNKQATENPHFLTLELIRHSSKQVRENGQRFSSQQSADARKAGETIRAGKTVPVAPQKALKDMTQRELDAMSTEELEKLVPEVG
jgi:hypothetical protein